MASLCDSHLTSALGTEPPHCTDPAPASHFPPNTWDCCFPCPDTAPVFWLQENPFRNLAREALPSKMALPALLHPFSKLLAPAKAPKRLFSAIKLLSHLAGAPGQMLR
ncbi:hypothetical protein GH733_011613 [Mirounga leonina]|nr:hypothetical protein GH733_011613 [Mirounga leonina]